MFPIVSVEPNQLVLAIQLIANLPTEEPLMVVVGRGRAIRPDRPKNIGEVFSQPAGTVKPQFVPQNSTTELRTFIRSFLDIAARFDSLASQRRVDVVTLKALFGAAVPGAAMKVVAAGLDDAC